MKKSIVTKSIRIPDNLWEDFLCAIDHRKESLDLLTLPMSTAISEAMSLYIKKYGG